MSKIGGCPNDLSEYLDFGEVEAVVNWNPPWATDNIDGIMDPLSDSEPGELLSIYGSPYTIKYIATDSSDNEDLCSFMV